ncbi:MAG: chemotaxis protein CheX [Bdellovibrionales bacterium]|nr:chemotaxis protein CheX [Bdellovibrionales bacterium]
MSFEKKIDGRMMVFQLKDELTDTLAASACAQAQEELDKNTQLEHIVFDLGENGISYHAFRHLCPLGLAMRKAKKQMFALTTDMATHRMIRSEGMDKTIKPIQMLSEVNPPAETPAAGQAAPAPSKLDVSFINPFVEGTLHVLKVQAQTEAAAEKPFMKTSATPKMHVDIAGILGITSKTFNGGIAICFTDKVFLAIMSKMFGEEYKEITKDLEDGAGEILNMIFGHAKKILNEKGHAFDKALPTIVRAPNLSINHSSKSSLILPFKAEAGTFFMEISTEKF